MQTNWTLYIRKINPKTTKTPVIGINVKEVKKLMDVKEQFLTALGNHGHRTTIRFGQSLRQRYSNSFYIDFKLIDKEVMILLDTTL